MYMVVLNHHLYVKIYLTNFVKTKIVDIYWCCDDCVKYHLGKCKECGLTTKEVNEAMGVATLVGGTIVIPHLRRAFEYWEALEHA